MIRSNASGSDAANAQFLASADPPSKSFTCSESSSAVPILREIPVWQIRSGQSREWLLR